MRVFGILSRMCSHWKFRASLVVGFVLLTSEGRGAADPQGAEFFEKRVRPVLVERCNACHGEKIQWGGLRLDSLQGLQKGGTRGPAFVAGKPEESLLIKAISHEDAQLQMPPTGKLPDDEIGCLDRMDPHGCADSRGSLNQRYTGQRH